MMFNKRRKMFETWILKQVNLNRELLRKDPDGAYVDHEVNTLFIGFCVGWEFHDINLGNSISNILQHKRNKK